MNKEVGGMPLKLWLCATLFAVTPISLYLLYSWFENSNKVENSNRVTVNLGRLENTEENYKLLACTFDKALEEDPQATIVRVYVCFPSPAYYRWKFLQYHRQKEAAYFGAGGKIHTHGTTHANPPQPPVEEAYVVCRQSEKGLRATLGQIMRGQTRPGRSFDEAFSQFHTIGAEGMCN